MISHHDLVLINEWLVIDQHMISHQVVIKADQCMFSFVHSMLTLVNMTVNAFFLVQSLPLTEPVGFIALSMCLIWDRHCKGLWAPNTCQGELLWSNKVLCSYLVTPQQTMKRALFPKNRKEMKKNHTKIISSIAQKHMICTNSRLHWTHSCTQHPCVTSAFAANSHSS